MGIGAINNLDMKDRDSQLIYEDYRASLEAKSYGDFLRALVPSTSSEPENDLANVVSHPFEETYSEYLRQRKLTGVYEAAQQHIELAAGAYHEVDLDSLERWKYHGGE